MSMKVERRAGVAALPDVLDRVLDRGVVIESWASVAGQALSMPTRRHQGDSMERDMDLVRDILNRVAAHPEPTGWVPLEIPDRSREAVAFHVKLLYDAGYLEADNVTTMQNFDWRAKRLTWEGHELRDALKNDTVWQRVKKVIAEKGGGASIEIVKQLAIEIGKRYFVEGLS